MEPTASVFNKNRIAKNTAFLYLKMLFTMFINLYTTRLVLSNLGVEDMGIYGFVGSIVGFFSIFSTGLTTAIQRFITFEAGKQDGNVNLVFCCSVNVLVICSVVLVALIELGGCWYLYHYANLPSNSLNVAFGVLQCSVITAIVTLISIPYNALIIANEKMNAFAMVSVLQALLTCAAAYFIGKLSDSRLIVYSVLLMAIGIFIRLIYQIYCNAKFKDVKYHLLMDKQVIKQIGKFATSTSLSGSLQVVSNQGVVLIFNAFFGVAVNAVYTIALQIKNSFISFSYNLNKAIAPQITKTYANGEMDIHKRLVYIGSRMEAFLNFFIMIPFLFKAEYIMSLWLGNVPPHAVEFCRLIIFISLLWAAVAPFYESVMATGKVGRFLIWPELVYMMVIPFSWFISSQLNNPEFMMATIVVFEGVAFIMRMYCALQVTDLKLSNVLKDILMPCLLVGVLGFVASFGLLEFISGNNLVSLLLYLVLNTLILSILVLTIGLKSEERKFVLKIVAGVYNKVKSHNHHGH